VLPLIEDSEQLSAIVLPVIGATAIGLFAARHPTRAIEASAVAVAAASDADAATYAASSAGVGATYAAAAASAAASAVVADASIADAAAAATSAVAISEAVSTAAFAATAHASVIRDAGRLYNGSITVEELARDELWSISPPAEIEEKWRLLSLALMNLGPHWQVWIDWYRSVAFPESNGGVTEAEDAAFTDFPDDLPWAEGAEVVNTEIARRLSVLRGNASGQASPTLKRESRDRKAKTLAQLAKVVSPQPFITEKRQLDAGPNRGFDLASAHDDLSTLPLRQRNLIKGILLDLPANAPKYLKGFLRSYDEELKSRGAQPILGLLQDDAEVVAAAVTAPRATNEWLEPGMRKAFDLFAKNHQLFVRHFPLDAEREALYANTAVDEVEATGKEFIEPFEQVGEAARTAHKAKVATDDFMMVIDKLIEFARVISTQPPAPSPSKAAVAASAELEGSFDGPIKPVTTKKRLILNALGFFERTYNLTGTTVTVATAPGLAEALKPAIDSLLRLIH
jgi:hypothetical protein